MAPQLLTHLEESRRAFAQHQPWSRHDLISALEHDEFVPYFQPKIDLASGAASCTETLARWNHPELGMLPPSAFVQQMEHEGLVGELTEALVRQLLQYARAALDAGVEIGYAINVSALTLEDQQACDRLLALVRESGVPPAQITIELTETAAASDFGAVLAALTRFREEGFGISADDFGMGHSTLHQLNEIPFTEIKIDQLFVAGLFKNARSMKILESIVHLAQNLGMRTVAEGIETREQLDFIKSSGCSAAQGFYLGAPMAHADLINYLRACHCDLGACSCNPPTHECGSQASRCILPECDCTAA